MSWVTTTVAGAVVLSVCARSYQAKEVQYVNAGRNKKRSAPFTDILYFNEVVALAAEKLIEQAYLD